MSSHANMCIYPFFHGLVLKKARFRMHGKRVVRFCIYGTLVVMFTIVTIEAFRNLFSEKTSQFSKKVSTSVMPIPMPSMTICPTKVDYNSVFIEAKDILNKIENFRLEIIVDYKSEK